MLREHDAMLRAAARTLREDHIDETFDARVMQAIRVSPRATGEAPPRVERRPSWRARAGWLLAAAAVFVVVLASIVRPGPRSDSDIVVFSLDAPLADRVAVVGDFNGWDRAHPDYQASRDRRGGWTLRVPIRAGHHRYSFVVDDSLWVPDPRAPRVRDPDFGVPNSALVVALRSR